VTLPASNQDAGLEAFRKELAEVAKRKDRAALAQLVVPQGFFWQRENGDGADPKKSGIDNLAITFDLDAKDVTGWEVLAEFVADQTASPVPDRPNLVCSPADPTFNASELEAVIKSTQTDPSDWGYPLADGVEVRDSALPDGKATEKLGMNFVRVMPDTSPLAAVSSSLRIVTPSGKVGYISADSVAPLGSEQLCYIKDGNSWKIAGYVGDGSQQ
jgi:hypothetical protein